MRAIGLALILVITAASPVRADGPIAVNGEVGIDTPIDERPLTCYRDHARASRPVFKLDVAYRFIHQLAAGVHVGGREYPWEDCGGGQMYRGTFLALELGAAVHWSKDRFWLAAWLGMQSGQEQYSDTNRGVAYAFGGGVDVYIHPDGHRVGVYVDYTNANGARDAHEHVSAGITYRYW